MDYKDAITILIKMSRKPSVGQLEKQALLTAVGVLSWASLAKSRLKRLRPKGNVNQ